MNIKELVLFVNWENVEIKYTYIMVAKEYNNERVYGIVAKKEIINNGSALNSLEEKIDIISKNRELVENLLDLLHKNQVSPIHLIDVIGEVVDNCVFEFN